MKRASQLVSIAFTILLLIGTPSAHAQSPDRVLTAVNPAQRIVLPNHHPSWAEPSADGGAVPKDFPLTHLTLVLARSPEGQLAFEKFLQDQQDPTSPEYHHWLTPVEVGARFGVSKHDILAITQWLQSQNLHVDSVSDSRMLITFSGPASAVGTTFGTEMHYFNVHGEKRLSVNSEPQIPAALAPVIKSVHGLFTLISQPMHHMVARPSARKSSSGGLVPDFTSGTSHFLTPGDFAVIYDQGAAYNANAGAGVMIGIIGRSRVDNTDIEEYQNMFQPTFPLRDPRTLIPPNGIDPGPALTAPPAQTGVVPPSSGDQGEATLDVTRSGSVAPGATVAMIISASSATMDGVDIATQYAIDANPVPTHIMSISFGSCESNAGAGAAAFYDILFSQGAAEGISIFVSSGDSAAAGCDPAFQTPPASQILSINVLCASGYVTCVGGTEFADFASPSTYWSSTSAADGTSALSYILEGAWNEPMNGAAFQVAGTGGGVSSFIPTPSWQIGTGVPAARAGRYTPDVAFSASGHDGYLACLESGSGTNCALGGLAIFSGTSAAAPDMAGITALLVGSLGGAPLGNLNPMLYKLAAAQPTVFHDVTVASSGVSGCVVTTPSMCNNSTPAPASLTGGLAGYLVGTGYDEATGLGSIDIGNLLGKWTTLPPSGATTTSLSVNENPAFLGNSVKFTATVTTSGASAPTGSVDFTDGGSPLGSGTLSGGAATFTTTTLTAGSHVITAVYGGDGNNTGSSSTPLTQQVLGSYPSPSTISLSPSSTIAGGAGFNLAVQGSQFFPASTVLWNGSARPTTYVSGTQLLAAITTADITLAGTNSVTVSNPAPGGGVSNSATFDTLEAFSGSGGFLSMFLNGGGLGNSAMFQNNNGLIGLGTTSPQASLDVQLTTGGTTNALNSTITLNNSSPITGSVLSAFKMTLLDQSTASNLSKQPARFVYLRDAAATGGVTAFDSVMTATSFLAGNAPYPLRGVNIEGPTVNSGKTLSNFTGLYIGSPGGAGTVSNKFALVTEPNAGNVGIGTTAPVTPLQVAGDIRVGTSGANGCLQNFAGSALAGTCSSDLRLKTNILPFAHVLDKLVKLEPVHFDWNTQERPDYHFGAGRNSGLIAQDVEKVFPEMVTADAQGYKMVNYSELPYLTLAAIRELKDENDTLRSQLSEKNQELAELHQQVASVQARLARLERNGSHRAKKKPANKSRQTP